MRVEYVTPFLKGLYTALAALATDPHRGGPSLQVGPVVTSYELTAVTTLSGDLDGMIYCGISRSVAKQLMSAQGETEEIERVASSLLSEACAMGVTRLEQQGLHCAVSTPELHQGQGISLPALGLVLVVPLMTSCGDLEMGIALQPETSAARHITVDAA